MRAPSHSFFSTLFIGFLSATTSPLLVSSQEIQISVTVKGLIDDCDVGKIFPLDPGFDVHKVIERAIQLPSHSWEYGTAIQMLLEIFDPEISVFGVAPFPIPTLPKEFVAGMQYAADKIVLGTGANGLSDGDGAVGDPASLGVGAVLLGKLEEKYAGGADEEVNYMSNDAPRWWNGAISHRADVPELWADFLYMAPPFLAYYAADKNDGDLLHEAVKQCGYYREALQANITGEPYFGVWEHIVGPQSADPGLWSTGNAWAAAGMTRVYATVAKAPVAFASDWQEEAKSDLVGWIKEILDGARGAPREDDLLRNYLNDTETAHGFGEISGSSLLAATAYRMAVMEPATFGDEYIEFAEGIRHTLGGKDKNGDPHITKNGTATPAVNPLGWGDEQPFTAGSPEGNNFVALLFAAWRDCVFTGRCHA